MTYLVIPLAFLSLTLSGAIFGFFYAWVCSTMWGLDAADPRVAIQAMQAMNASVRNMVFAPAFFGTPIALIAAGALAFTSGRKWAAIAFAAAGVTYFFGGMVLTMAVNVPMNDALAEVAVPADLDQAKEIWSAYSSKWQFFNQIRTVASCLAMMLAGVGLYVLRPSSA
ncbi:MAG: DUF1772 domain-containing protein [Paracoccaceae bacterium]|nr:DUF1772 domain-containing protein [Paracoccaceae bacterium]